MLFTGKIKWIFVIIVAFMTIINVGAAVLIFGDIQVMQIPETTISIDILEVTTDEIVVAVDILIDNPNEFSIRIENLEIVTADTEGKELDRFELGGGSVPGKANRTFSATDHIDLDGELPYKLVSRITGDVALVFFGFIKKSVDLNMNVLTSVDNVMDSLAIPTITINADIEEITQEGVDITGDISIYNPNTFDLSVSDISVKMETDTGISVGFVDMTGGVIKAKDDLTININGTIEIESLNAEKMLVTIEGSVGAKVAGTEKTISLDTSAEIKMPDLDNILPSGQLSDVDVDVDFRTTLRGLVGDITLKTVNPTKISLEAKDIELLVSRVDDGVDTLIASTDIEDGIIEAENITIQTGEIVIPYRGLYFDGLRLCLPDSFKITVRANVTIPGLDHYTWIAFTGYQDMSFFK